MSKKTYFIAAEYFTEYGVSGSLLNISEALLQHQGFKWLAPYPSCHLFPLWFACRAHKGEVKVRLSCWSQELEIELEIAWHRRSVSLKAVTALTFGVPMPRRTAFMLVRISCPQLS